MQQKLRSGLADLSRLFYKHFVVSTVLFISIFVLGLASYLSFLDREGFPAIQFPLAIVNGVYAVDDQQIVDDQVAKPISDAFVDQEDVDAAQTFARESSFTAVLTFSEGTDPIEGRAKAERVIEELNLPTQVQYQVTSVDPGGYLFEFDALVAVYPGSGIEFGNSVQTSLERAEYAQRVSEQLAQSGGISEAEVVPQIRIGQNPATGQEQTIQESFGRVAIVESGQLEFSSATLIGISKADSTDVLELSAALEEAIESINTESDSKYRVVVGAEFATQLQTDISSLQSNLLTGIIAVAVISLILISWRAAIVSAAFIVTVMLATFSIMWIIGYSINTITLFALVLALGLFVDDATIIAEAIDAEHQQKERTKEAMLQAAIRKVGLASFAGTMTTILVFLPLTFVSGILGEFIRLLPITIIISLLVSYVLSLTFIAFMSRFTLLRGASSSPMKRVQNVLGNAIQRGVLGARPWLISLVIIVSIAVVASSGFFASKAGFNIFPSSSDSNQLLIEINYVPGTTISQAEAVADDLNTILVNGLDGLAVGGLYGGFNGANAQSADVTIDLVAYSDRDQTAPDIAQSLQQTIDEQIGSNVARINVGQIDAGPPAGDFPFAVQVYGINGSDQPSQELAIRLSEFLSRQSVELLDGSQANVTDVRVQYIDTIARQDGRRLLQVGAAFDNDQVSAVLGELQTLVEQEFADSGDQLGFDFGQESENSESFAALGLVFPIALLAMIILLAIQFKSIIQPLLIFLAIPFGMVGAFAALAITGNPISFFSSVGLIGLLGIAVNNTILLTDYANQARRSGSSPREAIAEASAERFRPLVATTLTTIVALLPLALYDPFWQPLAVAIIGGLLSSTTLVIIAFPYYYLAVESGRVRAKRFLRRVNSQ